MQDKIEEIMSNPAAALVITLMGYCGALCGIAGGFRLLYAIVGH